MLGYQWESFVLKVPMLKSLNTLTLTVSFIVQNVLDFLITQKSTVVYLTTRV